MFFFTAALFLVLFFEGAFRYLSLVLMVLNIIGLHVAEQAWPQLVHHFQGTTDRLVDLSTGYILSIGICSLMLWVVLTGFHREKGRLEDAFQALHASEEKFQRIFHGNPDALLLVEPESRTILEVNQGFEKLTGYSRSEALGHEAKDLGLWRDPADRERMYSLVSKRKGFLGFQAALTSRNGTLIWAEISMAEVSFGGETRLLFTIRNVTDRYQAQAALQENQALLDGVVNSTGDFIFSVDSERFGLVIWNRAFAEFIQETYGSEVRAGLTCMDLLPTKIAKTWKAYFEKAIREGPFTMEYKTGLGDLPLLLSFNLLRKAGQVFGVSVFGKNIKSLKLAEEELKDSEKLYREILERQGEGFGMVDGDEYFILANPRAEQIFGVPPGELVGRCLTEFLNPVQQAKVKKETEYRARTKDAHNTYLLDIQRLSGEIRTIQVTATSRHVPGLARPQVIGVFRDVTEEKMAERTLQESEQRFRRLLEAASIPMAVIHASGHIEYLNQQFTRVLGYTSADLPDIDHWWKAGFPDSEYRSAARQAWEASYRDTLSTSKEIRGDAYVKVTTKSGELRMMDIRGSQVDHRTIVTLNDLTDRFEAEEAMRRAFTAVEQSPGPIVITDLNGRIQYVNAAFTRITGYSEVEALDRTPAILKSGTHPQEFYRDMWETIFQGRTWRGKFQNRKKDGSLYWERATISPIHDVQGGISHFVAVKEDITESLKAEAERLLLECEVQQAQKINSLGVLAGSVAHDFNNMLNGIIGYADLLMVEENDPVRSSYIASILQAALRSAELTRKLLAFGRRGKNLVECVDLRHSVEECLTMLLPTISPNLTVIKDLWEPSVIDGDPSQVNQVLLNLCMNALDAMPPDGTLTISCWPRVIDPKEEMLPRLPAGDYVELSVSDTGVGMTEEIRQRIFEPFFTTKTAGHTIGTGLGLSTVYGIVMTHRGFITVDSKPGMGTTFRVLFPAGTLAPAESSPVSSAKRGQGWILVVEDEPILRELAVSNLESLGYQVRSAGDGKEGIEIFII